MENESEDMRKLANPILISFTLILAACGSTAVSPASVGSVETSTPADQFFANLHALCGQTFGGRVLTDLPVVADNDAFAGKQLLMHVRECTDSGIRIPFHVGDDRSRTWVVKRSGAGLRLKHDHRHADGSPDATTLYGGDSQAPGTATRQAFPVDAESVTMFERNGLSASLNNTWALHLEPGQRMVYELSRPNGRLFQVEFDLTQPLPTPLPPWGAQSE